MTFEEFIESLAEITPDERYLLVLNWIKTHAVNYDHFKQLVVATEIYEDLIGETVEIDKTYELFKTWFETAKDLELPLIPITTFGKMFILHNPLHNLDIERRCTLLEIFINHLPKESVQDARNLTDLFLVQDVKQDPVAFKGKGILAGATFEQKRNILKVWNSNQNREQIDAKNVEGEAYKIMFLPFIPKHFTFDGNDPDFIYYSNVAKRESDMSESMKQLQLAQRAAKPESDSSDYEIYTDDEDDEIEKKKKLGAERVKFKADKKEDDAIADKAAARFKSVVISTKQAIRTAKEEEASSVVHSPIAAGLKTSTKSTPTQNSTTP